MGAPLASFLRALNQIILPIGVVIGIAGATAGFVERKKKSTEDEEA